MMINKYDNVHVYILSYWYIEYNMSIFDLEHIFTQWLD